MVFAQGRYAPFTSAGRNLLAHELTHSIQQVGGFGTRDVAAATLVQRQPEGSSRELTEEDEKSCSPLYLQKLCVEIIGGFQGDRSGVETAEEMARYNETCRDESGYTGPDVELSTAERLALRTPKCPRGDAAKRRDLERAARIASALDRSVKYMPAGIGEQLVRLVNDPVFLGSLALAVGVYLALWLVPEPLFSKIAAAATTIAILSTGVFTISTIIHLAEAWMDLDRETGDAKSDAEIETAAEHFGKRIGAVEADLLVFLASILVGGRLPGPKSAPGAGQALARAERSLANAEPGGVLIEGPWGRASAVPASGGGIRGNLALKVETSPVPAEAPAPAPAPAPKAAPAPAPAKAALPAKGTTPKPVVPVVPGAGTGREETTPLYAMRFQVQWDTGHGGPTFATPAVARTEPGVTTTQAVGALWETVRKVTPGTAQQAAQPAAAKQEGWIRTRPPAGVGPGVVKRPEYFPYKRTTDARVDVENLRGKNLKV